MEKINLVELLKECPKGMELDCTLCDSEAKVFLEGVSDDNFSYPIKIKVKGDDRCMYLTENGCWNKSDNAKCIIFPKGKNTWEGFVPPCQFKDGDIISNGNYVAIFYKIGTPCHCTSSSIIYYHCYYSQKYCKFKKELDFGIGTFTEFKYATEEERQKLFNVIKVNGYKWNEETKTLEKLTKPKFKVGDRIKNSNNHNSSIVVDIKDDCFIIKTLDGFHNSYLTDKLPFNKQDDYELVPNKFDINTLKPFDRVLVRLTNNCVWMPKFFSHYDTGSKLKYYPFIITDNIGYPQCIPYEKNEYLSNTTEDCDEYYKTWK